MKMIDKTIKCENCVCGDFPDDKVRVVSGWAKGVGLDIKWRLKAENG